MAKRKRKKLNEYKAIRKRFRDAAEKQADEFATSLYDVSLALDTDQEREQAIVSAVCHTRAVLDGAMTGIMNTGVLVGTPYVDWATGVAIALGTILIDLQAGMETVKAASAAGVEIE